MRRSIVLAVATSFIATPALAQVTNEGLLNYNMGRMDQRLRDQAASIGSIGEAYRESELKRCLEIVAGGSPLPSECRALVPEPRSSERRVAARIIRAPSAPVLVQSAAPRKMKAKTPSGYCLDVPPGYVGTGAENSPAISSAMPACGEVFAADDSAFRRYPK